MAINLGNDYLTSLVDTGLSAIDDAFASNVGSDTTIKTALPAEAGIRNSLSFSNIRISFPTREGNIPFLSALTTNSLYFPAYIKSFEDNYSIAVTGAQILLQYIRGLPEQLVLVWKFHVLMQQTLMKI